MTEMSIEALVAAAQRMWRRISTPNASRTPDHDDR
jgi:hypothetical protein